MKFSVASLFVLATFAAVAQGNAPFTAMGFESHRQENTSSAYEAMWKNAALKCGEGFRPSLVSAIREFEDRLGNRTASGEFVCIAL